MLEYYSMKDNKDFRIFLKEMIDKNKISSEFMKEILLTNLKNYQ